MVLHPTQRFILIAAAIFLAAAAGGLWTRPTESDLDDSGKRDLKKYRADLNRDGHKDYMECYYHGGSGFGGWSAEIRDGRSGVKYEVSSYSSFARIKNVIPIPPKLLSKANRLFLPHIKKCILPPVKRRTPDPSLEWILNVRKSSRKDNRKARKDTIFESIFSASVRPFSGPFKIPGSYYMDLDAGPLQRLYRTEEEPPIWLKKASKGWLTYNGQIHRHRTYALNKGIKLDKKTGLVKIPGPGSARLFKSSHGLVLKKDSLYQWLFISDYDLVDAPDKLRRPSITRVKWASGLVFLLRHMSNKPSDIFVIDPARGRFGPINTYDEDGYRLAPGDFAIVNNHLLLIENKRVIKKFPLSQLKLELNKF